MSPPAGSPDPIARPGPPRSRDNLLRLELDPDAPTEAKRRHALDEFAAACKLPPIERVEQRGRDADATFSLEMADGTRVKVGAVDVLRSRTKLSNVLIVAIGVPVGPLAVSEWAKWSDFLFSEGGVTVNENVDTFADTVRSWLQVYARSAPADADGVEPATVDGLLYIHFTSFMAQIARRHSASVKEPLLRGALGDLGFETWGRQVYVAERGERVRKYRRFYRAPVSVLEDRD